MLSDDPPPSPYLLGVLIIISSSSSSSSSPASCFSSSSLFFINSAARLLSSRIATYSKASCSMENEMSYQVIRQITNNYDEARILGSGGFGTVYKAIDEKGETTAVKVFDLTRFDDSEFRKEFDNLKRLQHENIVGLVGFCNDKEDVVYTDESGKQVPAEKLHTALCLEYVQNGDLGKYITDESKGFHWPTRYNVIKGVCEGLKYFREGIDPPILHLDLKPQNILLDKDMIPKIADFGLSRFFGEEKTTKTSSACGTMGYTPPEYTDFQLISEKFDIYSLGVIMAKIIAGRENFFRIGDVSRKVFINKVQDKWKKQLGKKLTSGPLLEVYCQQVRRCVELALDCMKKNSKERPTIQEIVSSLTETETMIGNLGLHIDQFPHGEFIENHPDAIRPETEESRPNAMIAPEPPTKFPFDYLKRITDGFSDERLILQYESGTMYKGLLEDGQVISVMKFKQNSPIARDRLFDDIVPSLSQINHKNLARIVGFCREAQNYLVQLNGKHITAEITETLLCYEYLSAGNLAEYNYGMALQYMIPMQLFVSLLFKMGALHSSGLCSSHWMIISCSMRPNYALELRWNVPSSTKIKDHPYRILSTD